MDYKPLIRRKTINLIAVCFTLFFIPEMVAQEKLELGLRAAVDSALTNNPKIRQYQQVVLQKKYLDKAAVGNFLPSVDVMGGYTYLSQNPEVNMSQVKGSLDDVLGKYGAAVAGEIGFTPEMQQIIYDGVVDGLAKLPAYNIEIDQQQYPSLNVVALQPIFMGGKIIAGKRFSAAELEYAHQDLRQVSNEVVRETIERYYGVALLRQVVATRREVLAGMKKHENQARRAIEIGVIPPHELLRAQVAVANAERDLADDLNRLDLAALALKSSMGLNQTYPLEIIDSLTYKMVALNLSGLETESRSYQPVFRMIEQKKIMVDQQHALDVSEFLPQIAAWGEYGWFRDEYPIVMPPYMVGIQAKMNLFHGLAKVNKLKATHYLKGEVVEAQKYATDQIDLWVNKSYREVLNKEDRYLKMKPTLELAQKNLEINEKRFQEGLSRSIDVIDARLMYEGVVIERLKSLYDYYIALTDLYYATGNPEEVISLLNN